MTSTPHQSIRTAVIGGGLGGLSAAIHLARRGADVTLFERNDRLGGKMNEWSADGYRFDTGPSLLTMPEVIAELLDVAGIPEADRPEVVPVDPICRYFWPDGSRLDAVTDVARMIAEMERFSPGDALRYADFLDYSRRIYDITAGVFLHTPVHEWRRLMTPDTLGRLARIHQIDPLRTMHRGVRRFFRDPRLIQLFDRYATYNGSDPFQAPATLNIIPWVEFGMGGFYLKGGMYRLVEVLRDAAESLGVRIHTGTPVEAIEHGDGRIRGVRVNGEPQPADVVICNADVVEAHRGLIAGLPQRRERLEKLEPSLSGMVFLWGVRGEHAQLAHHNIFFSTDYRREFRQIFHERRAPDDPTIYLAITSKSDPDHAPAGAENWFILLNMPYDSGRQDWEAEGHRLRGVILERLRAMGMDVAGRIETESVWTPDTFYRMYGSNRGSIYGISSNRRSTAFRRPANRSRDIEGLYFAGGSTHPGGGIPLVLLSGKMAAELAAERSGLPGVTPARVHATA